MPPGHFLFHTQKWGQQAFLLENHSHSSTAVSLNYMSEQPLLCSHLCIIRMGPIKSLVSLYFLVILPPLSIWPSVGIFYFFLAQFLLWFRNWWFQHISQRESRTSRRVSVSVWKCGVWRGCSVTPFPCKVWALLALCLLPQLPLSASLELSWNASALFYSPFGVLSLDVEHSSAMFTCHVPTRLGTAMQQI